MSRERPQVRRSCDSVPDERPVAGDRGNIASNRTFLTRSSAASSFYERKEIKDLLAYLRLISNPDDDISLAADR